MRSHETVTAEFVKAAHDGILVPFQAVGKHITYVGAEVGMGQAAKACLQSLVGCILSSVFESLVLGAKAGISAEAWYAIMGTSVANTRLLQVAVPAVMQRKFSGTSSNVFNTYKDLTIVMSLAEECGVPMPVTAAAKQFFQAGNTKYPVEDSQCLIKLLECITGVEVKGSV